jgi:hypothetical protein
MEPRKEEEEEEEEKGMIFIMLGVRMTPLEDTQFCISVFLTFDNTYIATLQNSDVGETLATPSVGFLW